MLTDPNPTERQLEYLRTIRDLADKMGFPPTLSEISAARNVTLGSSQDILNKMKDKGLVTWIPSKSRTLKITFKGKF